MWGLGFTGLGFGAWGLGFGVEVLRFGGYLHPLVLKHLSHHLQKRREGLVRCANTCAHVFCPLPLAPCHLHGPGVLGASEIRRH